MKKVELIKKLKEFNKFDDLTINDFDEAIFIVINDFGGFDEYGFKFDRSIMIDVDKFIRFLQNNSQSYQKNFYQIFNFEDCYVRLHFSSYDV